MRLRIFIIFSCIFHALSATISTTDTPATILYINSYNYGLTWSNEISAGIDSTFKNHTNITYYTEYLDSKRFKIDFIDTLFYNYLVKKYQFININGILISDNNALDFYLKYQHTELFDKKPMVFCGISDLENYSFEQSYIYGVQENINFQALFNRLPDFFPKVENIYAILDYTTTGQIYYKKIITYSQENPSLEIIPYCYTNIIELDSLISQITPNDFIYYFGVYVDNNKEPVNPKFIINHIKDKVVCPILSHLVDDMDGIMAGHSNSGVKHGQLSSEILLKVLSGEPPHQHFYFPPSELTFNYTELVKKNIKIDELPKDARIININESFYKKNKKIVLIYLTILIFLIVLIILLAYTNFIQKKYRHELEISRDKALESDKLKSAFLANVSHELRTPLNAIVGFSELLIVENENKNLNQNISIINSNANLLTELVNDVLDLSLIDANMVKLSYSQVSIMSIINDVIEQSNYIVENREKKDIKIALTIPNNFINLDITIDTLKAKQIFINLINNAIKYTEQGSISLGILPIEDIIDKIPNTLIDVSKFICFYVSDTGIGIPEHMQKEVFNRFLQLDKVYISQHGGVGIGLNICQSYIQLMGGQIWINSEENIGTTVYFILPIYPQHHNL